MNPPHTEQASDATFTHVAIAVDQITDPWPLFASALGGQYLDRGLNDGFGWTQLRFANGFVVEGIHPEAGRDFLRKFLARSGPGPHHLTFNVADLDRTIATLSAAGINPIEEDRHDPMWREVFIHPSEAHGIVVQVAESHIGARRTQEPPEGFPDVAYDRPVASLGRVVHAVANLPGAVRLFGELLGGVVTSRGAAVDGNHWVELSWDGGGRLRLLEAAHGEAASWVGDRHGRLRHLYFSYDEPATVPGAVEVAEGRWVIESACGTRIVLNSTVH
ncbi:MAG: VOC family protein [Actinomycetota bacterium]